MNKSPSISFFVTIIIAVIASASCNIKQEILDAVSQPQSSLEEIILSSLVNRTNNLTLLPFFPISVKVGAENESVSAARGFGASLEQELLIASDEQRGKICLKNTPKCMELDAGYHPTLTHLTQHIFTSIPPFDLSSLEGVSQKCRKDTNQYIQDLKKFKLWAMKMYDASAKLPSGFLNGNINQLGDFDMCLSAMSEKGNIKGQYCLAALQVQTPHNSYLSAIHNLIQSHSAFKSDLQDPGHRVPRFSSINWALCVPHSCTAKDVEVGLGQSLGKFLNGTELEVRLEVDPAMCQHLDSKPIPMSTVLVSGLFAVIVLTAVAATVYDYHGGETKEILLAFSFRKTLSSLFSTKRSANDIEAVHGIRFINAFMLLLAHKSMALFFIPYVNRTEMSEILGQQWTVIGRAASLYTDPFIMMSGTLTAYSLFGKLQRSNTINIGQEYISRLFRIVPTLGALILFCTFILPWLSSGPQWNLVVTQHADNCKRYWWRNFLFIHNYFGFKDMCLTHTHHVGIDTQLFLASPLAILAVWKWPKRGVFLLVILGVVSTIMRYHVTSTKELSNYIHFGTSIQQLFKTADNMYILPAYRLTVYVMGILLGYLLRQCKNIRLSSSQLQLGNMIALLSFCVSFFGPSFMGRIDYVYDTTHAAWYAAFAPILWCMSFAWIIFTTHIGQKGLLGRLFSWHGFLVSTRLSYAVYLTQFPIFFYNVGTTKTAEQYGFVRKTLNINEGTWIIFLSIALTVLFEMPFQTIRNIMLTHKSKDRAKITFEDKVK